MKEARSVSHRACPVGAGCGYVAVAQKLRLRAAWDEHPHISQGALSTLVICGDLCWPERAFRDFFFAKMTSFSAKFREKWTLFVAATGLSRKICEIRTKYERNVRNAHEIRAKCGKK